MNRVILKESQVNYKIYRVHIESSNISYDIKVSVGYNYFVRERVNNVLKSSKWQRTSRKKLIERGILNDSFRPKY